MILFFSLNAQSRLFTVYDAVCSKCIHLKCPHLPGLVILREERRPTSDSDQISGEKHIPFKILQKDKGYLTGQNSGGFMLHKQIPDKYLNMKINKNSEENHVREAKAFKACLLGEDKGNFLEVREAHSEMSRGGGAEGKRFPRAALVGSIMKM